MPDTHYDDPRLVALYDIDNPWSADTDYYLALSGACDGSNKRPPKHILDLGCGTGLLTCAFAAQGHDALGVDPAPAMLSAAQTGASQRLQSAQTRLVQQPGATGTQLPGTGIVRWQPGNAQQFQSSDTFDLIVMTGHAFQTLLTDADIHSAFTTMARHLRPGGTVAFETRNPALDWQRIWSDARPRQHRLAAADYASGLFDDIAGSDWQTLLVEEHLEVHERTGETIRFSAHYDFALPAPNRRSAEQRFAKRRARLTTTSTLRLADRATITALAASVGLQVRACFGDWSSAPFAPATSPEMIFQCAGS